MTNISNKLVKALVDERNTYLGIIRGMGVPPHDAEQVYQESAISAMNYDRRIETNEKAVAIGIVRNNARNYLKRNVRDPGRGIERVQAEDPSKLDREWKSHSNEDHSAELSDVLEYATTHLPTDEKTAFLLTYRDTMPIDDAAERMGISRWAFINLQRKARTSIRGEFSD